MSSVPHCWGTAGLHLSKILLPYLVSKTVSARLSASFIYAFSSTECDQIGQGFITHLDAQNNTMKISKYYSGPKDMARVRYETSGAISLRDPKGFLLFLKRFSWRIISLATRKREGSISTTIRLFNNFGLYLLRLKKHNGEVFVIKYLKASQLALQKKIAGQPLKSLRDLEADLPLPRLTKSGLPGIVPLRHRRAIYSRSYTIIRLWLTLFSIYRVLKAPVKGKLNTITDPFSGDAAAVTAIEG